MGTSNYKYDILSKKSIKGSEELLPYFFADTPQGAETIYNKYNKLLNMLASEYSRTTNIPKSDLFGEALIGLAKACKNWDPNRSSDFKIYAIYRIKDELNEYVRNNMAVVTIPSYIKKANSHLNEIKSICKRYDIDHAVILVDQDIPDSLREVDAIRLTNLVLFIIRAAKRACVEYNEFLKKIEILPQDMILDDFNEDTISSTHENRVEAALIVEKLKGMMDPITLAICEGIMADKSFEQIGKELGCSKASISNKIKAFKAQISNFEKGEDNL
jgi:RNA polymerase sigma factor (sigma-70 family)